MNAFPSIKKRIKSNVNWICITEETTRLVLDRLLEHLDGEVSEDPKLIGRALYDQNLAIIHHFYGAAEGRG